MALSLSIEQPRPGIAGRSECGPNKKMLGGREELERIEIELLLEAVVRRYAVDFRDYLYPSLRRRVWAAVRAEQVSSISALQERVLRDPRCLERFVGTCGKTRGVTSGPAGGTSSLRIEK